MKKNKVIFYLIFALFHIGAFIFTLVLENNTNLLMSMISWIPSFKWITFLGVILVAVDIIWYLIAMKDANREKAALTHEVNTLKAKMFDLQEAVTKNTTTQGPINPASQV
jgi:hypothetical protein